MGDELSKSPSWYNPNDFAHLQELRTNGWVYVLDFLKIAKENPDSLRIDSADIDPEAEVEEEQYEFFSDKWFAAGYHKAILEYALGRDDYSESIPHLGEYRGSFRRVPLLEVKPSSISDDPFIQAGFPLLRIDLSTPDGVLRDAFDAWLRRKRLDYPLDIKRKGPKAPHTARFVSSVFRSWINNKVVELLLIELWAIAESVQLTNEQMGEILFYDDLDPAQKVGTAKKIYKKAFKSLDSLRAQGIAEASIASKQASIERMIQKQEEQ